MNPATTLGIWSVRLIGLFIALLIIVQLLVMTGQRGGETFSDNLLLSVPMFVAGAAAVAGFFAGFAAIFRYKDRSKLTIAATIIGLLVTIFILGEFISPH